MLALITWTFYAGGLYVLWGAAFRIAHGRWPMAYTFPPRDRYTWIDMGLSAAMWAYFAWCVWQVWPQVQTVATGGRVIVRTDLADLGGLVLVAIGSGLRIWTLVTLGPNWRMGQDAADTKHEFVTTGPYRFLNHPINTALVYVACGQVILTKQSFAAFGLVVVAVAYLFLQGRAEAAFWKSRKGG